MTKPAWEVNLLKTIASDKQAEVVLNNVRVSPDDMMPAPAETSLRARNIAVNLENAYLVGLAQKDFEIAINYAKERVQFGRPIGSFQAIQHKAADMVTDVDGMRFITYKAAWATSENEPSPAHGYLHGQGLVQRGQPPRSPPMASRFTGASASPRTTSSSSTSAARSAPSSSGATPTSTASRSRPCWRSSPSTPPIRREAPPAGGASSRNPGLRFALAIRRGYR